MPRIFPKFNETSVCKICGTNKQGKAILAPIDGTDKDNICEAEQVHLECVIDKLRCAVDTPTGKTIFYVGRP